jgi:hypothetical protein
MYDRYDKLADELKAVTLATVRTYYEKWVPDMRKTPLFGAIYIQMFIHSYR